MSEVSSPEVIDEVIQKREEICEVQSKKKSRKVVTSDFEDEKGEKKHASRKRRAKNYGSTSSDATSRRLRTGDEQKITQAELEIVHAGLKNVKDKLHSMETKLHIIEKAIEKLAPGVLQSLKQELSSTLPPQSP